MKNALLPLAALGLVLATSAASAQSVAATTDFSTADSDRSGAVSWTEFALLFPDVTEEEFKLADIDGDGELSAEEYASFNVTGSVAAPPAPVEDQPIPQGLSSYN